MGTEDKHVKTQFSKLSQDILQKIGSTILVRFVLMPTNSTLGVQIPAHEYFINLMNKIRDYLKPELVLSTQD